MSIVNFPANPANNQTFTSNGRLYVFDSAKSAWRIVVTESFYLLQVNAFTAPITGNVGYVPTETIQLLSIDLTLAVNASANIVVAVRKNNDQLQEFTISSGALSLTANFTANSITTSDTVFLDIVSGSGTDLVAKFNYK